MSNLVIPQVLSELRPLALSVPRSSVSFNNLELSPIDYTDRLHCLVAFEMMTSKCHCTIYCSTVHTLHPDSFSTTACPQQPATWSTRSCFSTLTVNAGHTCNDATCPLGVRTCTSTKLTVPGIPTPSVPALASSPLASDHRCTAPRRAAHSQNTAGCWLLIGSPLALVVQYIGSLQGCRLARSPQHTPILQRLVRQLCTSPPAAVM